MAIKTIDRLEVSGRRLANSSTPQRTGVFLPQGTRHVPTWDWRRGKRESEPKPNSPPETTFSCSTKQKRGEMDSCAEARFYLEQCGLTRLDADGDGVPCESMCR
jgi:hypothetical protein